MNVREKLGAVRRGGTRNRQHSLEMIRTRLLSAHRSQCAEDAEFLFIYFSKVHLSA